MGHKNKTKDFSRKISVYVMITCMILNLHIPATLAGPEGAQVVNGQVSFEQSGLNTTITASDKAIVNYSSFDIAQPEIVEFVQPGSSASVLNRILSANPTSIDGTLLANGRVFFVNPAGVIIGSGARINVNQLVASALNISNSDFINGRYNFAGGSGSVINHGDISAEKVYLIGKQIANSGTISCPTGYVIMTAGDRVFLGEIGSDVVVEIDVPSLPEPVGPIEGSAVLNEGTVEVGNGTIVLAAACDIYSQAISNVGTLSASVDAGDAGQIELAAADGQITNTGSIDATSNSAAGGTVVVEGEEIINTGTVDVTGSTGGQVAMQASSALGQFGTIQADGTNADGGTIDLVAGDIAIIGTDSLTTANAGLNGNGGEIKVLADMESGFAGLGPGASLQAKGGQESGDGGFIELSAANFQTLADIDISAQQGEPGTFLLDPTDIIIVNAAAGFEDYDGALGANPFTDLFPTGVGPDTGLAFLTPDIDFDGFAPSNEVASGYVATLLGGGTNVILQAQQDITIDDLWTVGNPGVTDFPIQWGGSAKLTLQAGRDITIAPFTAAPPGNFIGSTAAGGIHLEAYSPHNPGIGGQQAPGIITIGNNVDLQTATGTITLMGFDFALNGTITATGAGTVEIGTTVPGGLYDWDLSATGILTNTELGRINVPLGGSLIIGRAQTAGPQGQGGGTGITIRGITVDNIDTTATTLGNLHLVASGIDDADSGASNLTVTNLILEATGAIGSTGNPLDIDVTNVDVIKGSTGASDVVLYDRSGGVTITDLSIIFPDGYGATLTAGNLNVTADSAITVNSNVSAPGNITLTASETEGVDTDDIDIKANISSSSGNITLRAGDDILLNTAGATIESKPTGGGSVTLTAAYGDTGADSGGLIQSIAPNQGKISADSITLQVAGIAAGTIGGPGGGDPTGDPIQIDLGAGAGTGVLLTLTTSDAGGNIYVDETSGNLYSSDITINTDSGSAQTVYIENSDGIIDVDTLIGGVGEADNFSLKTSGSNKDITLSVAAGPTPGPSITTTGNVTLDATGAIRDGTDDTISGTIVDIEGATITLTAANGGIGTPVPGDRVLEVTATTQFNATTTDNSNINVDSIGNLPIGVINAGAGSSGGIVTLDSTGNMTDAEGTGPTEVANITGSSAVLTASTGIGAAGVAQI